MSEVIVGAIIAGPATVMVAVIVEVIRRRNPLKAIASADQTVVAGVAASFMLGSFKSMHPSGPYAIDVNWGDGSASTKFFQDSAGTVTEQFHNFSNAVIAAVVSVTITDNQGNKSNTATFNVAVAPPHTAPIPQVDKKGTVAILIPPTMNDNDDDCAGLDSFANGIAIDGNPGVPEPYRGTVRAIATDARNILGDRRVIENAGSFSIIPRRNERRIGIAIVPYRFQTDPDQWELRLGLRRHLPLAEWSDLDITPRCFGQQPFNFATLPEDPQEAIRIAERVFTKLAEYLGGRLEQ